MMFNPSPLHMPTLNEQLLALGKRRSVVDRLIRSLELYQRLAPVKIMHKRSRVA